MRLLPLLLLLPALVACGAQPAAVAPTSAPPTATASAPTAPPTATAPAPTAPPTATASAPTAAPTATAPAPTAAPTTTAPAPTAAPTATAPAPQASPAVGEPVRLVIPGIGLDRPLISVGLDRNRFPVVPNHDVGWYNLSARPGDGENIVIWGHVLRFKATPKIPAPFARLKELAVGAPLTLYSADGTPHAYVVVERVWATPDQVEYILPKGRELVTLVSCIGDKVVADGSVEMSHRLITIAARADEG